MGGIPLILSLLHCERRLVTERSETSEGSSSAGPHGRTQVDESEELMENKYKLKSACCAAIKELVMNDANAHHVVQANGIYSLGMLILPPCKKCHEEEKKFAKNLQRNSFRTLRYIFSMERNRRLFKRLFPPDLFEMFINIGHYVPELSAYKHLVDKINSLPDHVVEEIRANILESNHNRTPARHIGDYSVFELLGTGAFGSVYKVKKRTAGQSFLAMKEVNIESAAFGRNSQERDSSVGEIMNEISIIREQMKHPNVVRYYKTFVENQKLYIVMELIEGAPLGEHFNSLKEKKERFPEDRIWNIFMQMILALRYLHKEKGILHRDLTPNNIMLGEDDKVTITDFGLAKQKRSDCSKMTSVVGTMLYWCPEIVQNLAYGEKADIWALGCILYQMCTLKPPFFSDNMLALVTKIANADYDPIPKGLYSDRLVQAVKSCICKCADARPDTVQLASQMADKLLVHIDSLRINQTTMEKKLEKERHKAQRHYFEANQNMQKYHRLFLVSQERYDRLANLAGSGGAAGLSGNGGALGLRDGEVIDPALVSINIQNESVSSGGWTSDDDESGASSGTESRESSAGSTRGTPGPSSLPRPPHTPKTRRAERKSRSTYSSFSPLVLDIPTTSRAIRDSGYSSGDPSPNNSNMYQESVSHLDALRRYQRSNSTPSPQAARSNKKKSKRPTPAHLKPHTKRRMVERFKRALFAPQSTSVNLKSELKKLMSGSREIIDLNLGPTEEKRGGSAGYTRKENDSDKVNNHFDADFTDAGITYEQMQTFIEQLLMDSGYYRISQSEMEKSPPLGPIATNDLVKKLTS
ncbi:hypothetical protein FSP39_000448 [Pinctada imbricata]|uniref:Protein kinase domain-containing protein n=1 Tax=Pinctada imbricata TaxID=66713 RepID=A0AA88YWD8_PINIB|nr:hypothetical protein FSP39_000448 [Pinctada imbricata]